MSFGGVVNDLLRLQARGQMSPSTGAPGPMTEDERTLLNHAIQSKRKDILQMMAYTAKTEEARSNARRLLTGTRFVSALPLQDFFETNKTLGEYNQSYHGMQHATLPIAEAMELFTESLGNGKITNAKKLYDARTITKQNYLDHANKIITAVLKGGSKAYKFVDARIGVSTLLNKLSASEKKAVHDAVQDKHQLDLKQIMYILRNTKASGAQLKMDNYADSLRTRMFLEDSVSLRDIVGESIPGLKTAKDELRKARNAQAIFREAAAYGGRGRRGSRSRSSRL